MTPRLPIEVYGGAVFMDKREAERQCARACRELVQSHAVIACGNGWAVVRIYCACLPVPSAEDRALAAVVDAKGAESQLERFADLVAAGVDPHAAARSGRGKPS